MDTEVLEAQRREAEAKLKRATIGVETARAWWCSARRKRRRPALVAQRQAELDAAKKRFARAEELAKSGAGSIETWTTTVPRFEGAKRPSGGRRRKWRRRTAAIGAAESLVVAAQAAIEAAQATIERIQADIDDSTLKAPRDGRVQYRVAQPGEVLPAGGKVLNMVDLSRRLHDLLPAHGRGGPGRASAPRSGWSSMPRRSTSFPAKVTFVADVAQFTPKTVETAEERQKLMFRVKAHDRSRAAASKYITQVKTGLPGMAYVQLDPQAAWPANLQVKLPQ